MPTHITICSPEFADIPSALYQGIFAHFLWGTIAIYQFFFTHTMWKHFRFFVIYHLVPFWLDFLGFLRSSGLKEVFEWWFLTKKILFWFQNFWCFPKINFPDFFVMSKSRVLTDFKVLEKFWLKHFWFYFFFWLRKCGSVVLWYDLACMTRGTNKCVHNLLYPTYTNLGTTHNKSRYSRTTQFSCQLTSAT